VLGNLKSYPFRGAEQPLYANDKSFVVSVLYPANNTFVSDPNRDKGLVSSAFIFSPPSKKLQSCSVSLSGEGGMTYDISTHHEPLHSSLYNPVRLPPRQTRIRELSLEIKEKIIQEISSSDIGIV